jgi:hypothetical protein
VGVGKGFNLRSYPKSKKPVVATIETARLSGRPVKPMKRGCFETSSDVCEFEFDMVTTSTTTKVEYYETTMLSGPARSSRY